MSVTVYQYKGCSTCKKALRYLDAAGVEHRAVPIVDQPPSSKELRRLWKMSGLPLRKFFNVSGQSYRNGGFKERIGTMDEAEQLEALAADGKLIKRPILVDERTKSVLVGFREADYDAHFGEE